MSLRSAIIYHWPLDLANQYAYYRKRFADALRATIEGCPDIYIGCSRPNEDFDPVFDASDFLGIRPDPQCPLYHGQGCDIGTYIHIAKHHLAPDCDFLICCGATCWFPRAGWYKRLLDVRQQYGDCLYCTSASFEGSPNGTNPGPNPHIRSSFFACNPQALRDYPHEIKSREDCYKFEGGEWKVSRYIQPARMVTWDGVYSLRECRLPNHVFRKGNQSNSLVWDRRHEEYHKADPAEKRRLEALAEGVLFV